MPVYALGDDEPQVDPAAYVHPDAVVIGRVRIGAEASIWPGAVLRGDLGDIVVGERTSIQDNAVLHTHPEHPTLVGRGCVVGHIVYLEGCVVEDDCLVGSMSSVLPRARLGRGCVVAAGAVVTQGTKVPPDAMARGVPAVVVPGAGAHHDYSAGVQRYVDNARRYARELRRLS
jgi:carbonic anhydrase/acetyltransferase-like protein (isoleucine patch superfamily)